MKRLVLIKKSPAVQLGHLYEHIFWSHVDTLFYEHDLFPHLDYSLTGETYEGGIINITVELYTEAAIALSDAIPALPVKLNEEMITTAATQILAEKEEPLASTGYDKVRRELEDLHAQPWQSIDEIGLIDTKDIRKKASPFYIAEGKPLPARKLTTSVVLDVKFARLHRELLPLFRQFAWLITSSFQGVLADTHGYYSDEDAYKNTKGGVSVVNTFKVGNAKDIEVDVPATLETCLGIVSDLQKHDVFGRYMKELHAVSYYNRSDLAPNLERNYEDTLILIGPKGWQSIATEENGKLLLEHMSIEVKSGRDKGSRKII
jgi:hypothetical protein